MNIHPIFPQYLGRTIDDVGLADTRYSLGISDIASDMAGDIYILSGLTEIKPDGQRVTGNRIVKISPSGSLKEIIELSVELKGLISVDDRSCWGVERQTENIYRVTWNSMEARI